MTTFTSIDGTVTTTINDEGLAPIDLSGRLITVERCVTGPPYNVATGGFVSLDPRQSKTYYETRRDHVRIEHRGDHFLLWVNGQSARLDRATANEFADAIRDVTSVVLEP